MLDSDDHDAQNACNVLIQQAVLQIRATAHLQRHVGWSIGNVDTNEEIRRLADLCDGLAGPEAGSAERLRYRLGVLSEDQSRWVESALTAQGDA